MSNPPNSTNLLSRTISVTQNFVRNAPLTFSGTNDPAFTIGDWVRQFMLGPPFAWRWNRATATFPTVAGQQDYKLPLEQFGWLETASVTDSTGSSPVVHALDTMLTLGEESVQNLPTRIAPRLDDGNGNITFRLIPPPDKIYTATITYQVAAPLFVTLNDTWAPIPDYYSYLYTSGFLAKTYEYLDDSRFGPMLTAFLRQVIAANGALTDSQVDIFLTSQLRAIGTQQAAMQNGQLSRQGRGLA